MSLTTTTSGYYEGITLSDLEKNILFELGQLVGTTATYDRFPKWYIRQKLNDRQNKFVALSKCIKKFALLLCKADYREYKLPVNCMEGGVIAVKYYSSSDDYENLDIKDMLWLDETHEGWLAEASSEPMYCYMGDSYGNIPMLGVYPSPDTDGTAYTISPDTGVTTGGDLPGATTNTTGLATSGSGTTLNDTTVDFTSLGLVSGMVVNNVTDGSSSSILTIATTQIVLAATLTGGTANVFAAGDSYEILSGEYGVLTSWEDDDVIIFGSEVGVLSNITVPAGNIRVDYVPYPLPFPATGNDSQYPEIPKLYHMDYAMGVVADCLRTFGEGSKEFQRAAYYDQIFMSAATLAMSKSRSRPFDRKPVSLYPARRRM